MPISTAPTPEKLDKRKVLEVVDPMQLVVKNTFLSPVLRCESLEEFILERKLQSCPANSINIGEIVRLDGASHGEAAFNTASTLCDTDVPVAALTRQEIGSHTYPHPDDITIASAPAMGGHNIATVEPVFNTGSTVYDERGSSVAVASVEDSPWQLAQSIPCGIDMTSMFGTGRIDETVPDDQQHTFEDRLQNLRVRGIALRTTAS